LRIFKRGYYIFQEYVTEGAGSGVVLTEDGYIVTNHHVIDGASAIKVRLSGKTYAAELTGADAQTDLAVLKIDAKGLSPAKLADSSRARATGGYGIGLSTAKAIVARHRGRISNSYANGIITFTAAIPQTNL